MRIRVLIKTLSLAAVLTLSVNALATTKASVDFKALKIEDKVIATNGKLSYVIDPAALQNTIAQEGYAQIKIYGTDIWLTLMKNGEITVRKTHLINSSFYVLAALKDLKGTAEPSVNYQTFAVGYTSSKSLQYPASFCTGCAAPTSLDDKSRSVVKVFMTASTITPDEDVKPIEISPVATKPGSS